jgi:hypothetical protein
VQTLLQAVAIPGIEGEVFLISAERPVTWLEYYQGYAKFVPGAQIAFEDGGRLSAVLKKQNRNQNSVLNLLKRAAKSPRFRREALTLPGAEAAYHCLKRVVPKSAWERLKLTLDGGPKAEARWERPKCLPLPPHLSLFRSQTRVRIDKATQTLRYQPRHGLEDGLVKTETWARWFGVLA